MKNRIFKSINWLVLAVLVISDVLFTGLMYQTFLNHMEQEVRNNMTYVSEAVKDEGMEYLKDLPRGNENFRITLIDRDGTVIYDSVEEASNMENHSDREEFLEALRESSGESVRYSGSIGKQTYYYATEQADGTVLRLSITISSVYAAIRNTIPILILSVLLVLGVSFLIANVQAKKLTAPVNNLNLESPLDNDVYEELSPLLLRLENQNRQISRQIENERKQQQEIRTVTQNMQEGLILLNNDEEVLMINEACLRIFDCENAGCQGQHYLNVSRDKALTEAVRTALQGNKLEKRFDIHERSYQILANPVMEENAVTGAVLIVVDVTEAAQAEQRRREFVANVSHELKTPLMSISGYAEIIKDGIAKQEDIPAFSGRIFQEAKRLTTLVEDIIKLSELDDAKLARVSEKVDLKNMAEEIVSYLQPEAAKKDVSMIVEGPQITVLGVPSILEEMIYNLCDNAIKYNVKGGSVKVCLSDAGGEKSVTVADTGIGIPKEAQDRVFERFFRVDRSHSRESGGTGLGLSIVKHGAMLHHASVHLESRPGHGTSISLSFSEGKD